MDVQGVEFLLFLSLIVNAKCSSFENTVNVSDSSGLNKALQNVQNNTLVRIFPGSYILNVSVDLKNLEVATLQGTGEKSNDTKIYCKENVGLSFYRSSDITLDKVTFFACGTLRNRNETKLPFRVGILFESSKNISVIDSRIENSTGIGVGLYDVSGTVRFSSVVFENNFVDTNVHNETVSGGGVHVEFTDQTLDPNPNDFGKGRPLTTITGAYYTFSKCHFIGNGYIWTSITSDNSNVKSETLSSLGHVHGGGLSIQSFGNATGNTFNISECIFSKNQANSGGGMFFKFYNSSDKNVLVVQNSHFLKNYATGFGGGIRIGTTVINCGNQTGNSVSLNNCTFEKNNATVGGGLSIDGQTIQDIKSKSSLVTIEKCVWLENTAYLGAAMNALCRYKHDDYAFPFKVNISVGTFINNTTPKTDKVIGQGSVWIFQVPVILSNVDFTNNSNTALLVEGTSITIHDSVKFVGNSGFKGGAVALFGDAFFRLYPKSSLLFKRNSCAEKGGAIYVHWNGPPIVGLKTKKLLSHECFFQYCDENIHPDEWDTSVNFTGNYAQGKNASGSAVFADTLQACLRPGEDFQHVLDWKPFTYSGAGQTSPVITNPVEMYVQKTMSDWSNLASPNLPFNASLDLRDEKNSSVYSIVHVELSSEDNVGLSSSSYMLVHEVMEGIIIKGNIGSTYKVTLTTTGGQIVQRHFDSNVANCPNGYLKNNDNDKCICMSVETYGVSRCDNSNRNLYIKKGYWAGNVDNKLVVSPCPEDYCNCPSTHGALSDECFYNKNDICKFNRSGILCGNCKPGNSAELGTTECKEECTHSSNLSFLIFALFFTILLLVYFVMLINLDIFTGYLNAWLFSYQIIYVLLQEEFYKDPVITFVMGLAHVQVVTGAGVCQFKGMTSLHKLLYNYLMPVFVLLALWLLSVISQCWPHNFLFKRLNDSSPKRAFCTLFVLVYSAFTEVSFEILHPVEVGEEYRLYKDGSVKFFSGSLHIGCCVVAILVIILIVIPVPLTLIFRKIFIAKCPCLGRKYWVISILDTFQSCFREEYAWFAGFYFVARLVFVIFGTYIPSGNIRDTVLQMSCIIVLVIFVHVKPYRGLYNWINYMDFVLLGNLCLISVISGNLSNSEEQDVQVAFSYILRVLLYVPLVYSIGVLIFWLRKRHCPESCTRMQGEHELRDQFPDHLVGRIDSPLIPPGNEGVEPVIRKELGI